MFSSCAELVITGDKKVENQLKSAVSLILDGFGFKPVAFHMLPSGRAILYEYFPKDKCQTGLIEISKENQNVNFIKSMISMYLMTANYETAMRNIPRCEGDGSYYEGWRMTLDNSNIDDKIIIEPWWAFYHK